MGQEAEEAERLKVFAQYQVNADLVAKADPDAHRDALFCPPIAVRKSPTNVADGPHSALFPQAENRLHAQKAVLVEVMGEN